MSDKPFRIISQVRADQIALEAVQRRMDARFELLIRRLIRSKAELRAMKEEKKANKVLASISTVISEIDEVREEQIAVAYLANKYLGRLDNFDERLFTLESKIHQL